MTTELQDFLDIPFDTANEEASPAFALIPMGRYKAEIRSAKCGTTKNGAGYQVILNWSILEGEYENRTVWQSILIRHTSEDATRIGKQKFKDVLNAVGFTDEVTDLNVLLHKPCMIGVVVRQDKEGRYPDKNEVGRVTPIPPAYNGATRTEVKDALKEAQKVQPAFKATKAPFDDSIPF
jgi:hypothetical protein